MFYLLIALINAVFGVLIILTLNPSAAGFFLTAFIAGVLTILGIVGVVLYIRKNLSDTPRQETEVALKNWFQLARGVDILLILGLLFRIFVLQPFLVDGSSMEPNFHNSQFLLVDRLTYRFRAPERGDVIVFKYPKDTQVDYIKRIIGLPGETIEIKNNQVYVNNQLLNEDYLEMGTPTYAPHQDNSSYTVGPNEYFVLGDNRSNSSDSRDWGTVPKTDLIGRAWFIVYPFNYFGKVPKAEYYTPQTFSVNFKILTTSSSFI